MDLEAGKSHIESPGRYGAPDSKKVPGILHPYTQKSKEAKGAQTHPFTTEALLA
jgi:hypothetical protein